MLYPKTPSFPASMKALTEGWKGAVERAMESAATKLVQIFQTRLLGLGHLCPSTLHDLEQELHREIARECIDPVVGSAIQAAHSIPSVEDRALKVLSQVPDSRLQVAGDSAGTYYSSGRLEMDCEYSLLSAAATPRAGPTTRRWEAGLSRERHLPIPCSARHS